MLDYLYYFRVSLSQWAFTLLEIAMESQMISSIPFLSRLRYDWSTLCWFPWLLVWILLIPSNYLTSSLSSKWKTFCDFTKDAFSSVNIDTLRFAQILTQKAKLWKCAMSSGQDLEDCGRPGHQPLFPVKDGGNSSRADRREGHSRRFPWSMTRPFTANRPALRPPQNSRCTPVKMHSSTNPCITLCLCERQRVSQCWRALRWICTYALGGHSTEIHLCTKLCRALARYRTERVVGLFDLLVLLYCHSDNLSVKSKLCKKTTHSESVNISVLSHTVSSVTCQSHLHYKPCTCSDWHHLCKKF